MIWLLLVPVLAMGVWLLVVNLRLWELEKQGTRKLRQLEAHHDGRDQFRPTPRRPR